MTPEDACKQLATMAIEFTDASFFKYVKAGDREVVDLFLDAGVSPDICDPDRNAAVVIAAQGGQKDVARLLLARGASPEPLLNRPAPKKDGWDKLTASSSILSFVSSVLIAAVGGYFTYSYNQRQIDLNRTQSEHDSTTKEQANKVLELEAVQKLIPNLTSQDEKSKAAALIAIQDLAHPELAAHLALLFKGEGSVQYLQQAASSGSKAAKQTAIQALSTIASAGSTPDAQLAKRALSSVFESTKASVLKITVTSSQSDVQGSGVVVTKDGYILTNAHLITYTKEKRTLSASTSAGTVYKPHIVAINEQFDVALLKIDGAEFVPIAFAAHTVQAGDDVIGIGYSNGTNETAYTGNVTQVSDDEITFYAPTAFGSAGGPLLDSTGQVVGLMTSKRDNLNVAIRTKAISDILMQANAK